MLRPQSGKGKIAMIKQILSQKSAIVVEIANTIRVKLAKNGIVEGEKANKL